MKASCKPDSISKTIAIILVLMLTFATTAMAHSGRLDANGGHNCSEKSKAKGLCTGYHYHNGNGSDSGSSSKKDSKSSGSSSSKSTASKSGSQSGSKSTSNNQSTASKTETNSYKKTSIKLYVNNKEVKLKTSPVSKSNTNYFPLEETVKALSATVTFDSKKQTATLVKGKKQKVLEEKKDKLVTVNNTKMAPIRTIVEAVGGTLVFKQDKNAIYVTIK